MPRAGSKWRKDHCIQYDSYLIPKNHDLPDEIAFGYEDSIVLSSKKGAVFLERGLGQPELNSNGDVVMRDWSNEALESEKSKS